MAITILLGGAAPASAQQDLGERMKGWSAALGVACTHCHVDGAWSETSKPAFTFAVRMRRMLDGINDGPLKDMEPITCWTCHRGQARPARLPAAAWQAVRDKHVGEFTSPEAALTMSVYAASLGVDCSHCHEPGSFSAPTKPAHQLVAKMLPIFDEIPKYFDQSRMPRTQCYMCHQGQRTPERRPR
ncbi:MAG TPA: photosynthetic reaction center cytochrome c subunit family protein [Vicinamibacterales bacterium]|nr:photosynthetic reaction center cytochrome c subunit family protein [Vicinamibacterales bacterium]